MFPTISQYDRIWVLGSCVKDFNGPTPEASDKCPAMILIIAHDGRHWTGCVRTGLL